MNQGDDSHEQKRSDVLSYEHLARQMFERDGRDESNKHLFGFVQSNVYQSLQGYVQDQDEHLDECLEILAQFAAAFVQLQTTHQQHLTDREHTNSCQECLSVFVKQAAEQCRNLMCIMDEDTDQTTNPDLWIQECNNDAEDLTDNQLLACTQPSKPDEPTSPTSELTKLVPHAHKQRTPIHSSKSATHAVIPPSTPHQCIHETRFPSSKPSPSWNNPPSVVLSKLSDDDLCNVQSFEPFWNGLCEEAFGDETPVKFKFVNIDRIKRTGNSSVSISFLERPKQRVINSFVNKLSNLKTLVIRSCFNPPSPLQRQTPNPTFQSPPSIRRNIPLPSQRQPKSTLPSFYNHGRRYQQRQSPLFLDYNHTQYRRPHERHWSLPSVSPGVSSHKHPQARINRIEETLEVLVSFLSHNFGLT